MRSTKKKDTNGIEIFEGDRIIKHWGFFRWQGEQHVQLQLHTITYRTTPRGNIFTLGKAYNFWEGEDLYKPTLDELEKIGMADETLFFMRNEKAVLYTDQHFMDLSDEQWNREVQRRKQRMSNLIYGKANPVEN